MLQLLIDYKLKVNAKVNGIAPLHACAQAPNHTEIAAVLLMAGADVNSATTADGPVPVQLSKGMGFLDIIPSM